MQIKFLSENGTEDRHIRADRIVREASLGYFYALLNAEALIGEQLHHHTGAAESAARRSHVDKYLFLGHIRHLDLCAIGDVSVFKLIKIFHNNTLSAALTAA